jgi:hypothetical protein
MLGKVPEKPVMWAPFEAVVARQAPGSAGCIVARRPVLVPRRYEPEIASSPSERFFGIRTIPAQLPVGLAGRYRDCSAADRERPGAPVIPVQASASIPYAMPPADVASITRPPNQLFLPGSAL